VSGQPSRFSHLQFFLLGAPLESSSAAFARATCPEFLFQSPFVLLIFINFILIKVYFNKLAAGYLSTIPVKQSRKSSLSTLKRRAFMEQQKL